MLDTSILIAILVEEEGYGQYVSILSEAKEILIGAPTLAEAGIVLQNLKRGKIGHERLYSGHRFVRARRVAEKLVRELQADGRARPTWGLGHT